MSADDATPDLLRDPLPQSGAAMSTPGRYESIAEHANRVGVSHKTVRGMIARGELPAHRYGTRLMIDPEEAADVTRERVSTRPEPIDPVSRPRRRREVHGEFSRLARERQSAEGNGSALTWDDENESGPGDVGAPRGRGPQGMEVP